MFSYRDNFCFVFDFMVLQNWGTAKVLCVCVCFYIMKFAQGDLFALKALFSTSESNWMADG